MEGTGFSMFQVPSIHINNSAEDRLEEQEELEDQKRRKEELVKKLDNAFDDLQDDEDSVNNSANFTADQSQFHSKEVAHKLPQYRDHVNNKAHVLCETPKNAPIYQTENYYTPSGAGDGQNYCQEIKGQMNGVNMQLLDNRQKQQNMLDFENLKVMYEMRIKEFNTMAADNANLRLQYDKEIHMLQAQLSSAIIDKEKTELSLQQAHHLLSSSKNKICELEHQMNSLNNKIILSNEEKEQMKLELQSCTISLQETQHRLHSTQVDHTHKTDSLFREQQNRHREEVDRLQDDLIKTKTRLEEKDREMKSLELRWKERDREHEELIVEKSATINKLARELESAQNQMTNNETGKLKEKITQKQIRELGSKLEATAHELTQTRSKYVNLDKEYKDWRSKLQHIIQECQPENHTAELNSPGKLSSLKDILTKYDLEIQKLKTLQDEISKRDKKLEICRKQESELRAALDEQKTMEMQLKTKMTLLQDKLDLLNLNNDNELLESYKKQNTQLQQQIEQLRDQHKALDLKYTELEMENEKMKVERESRTNKAQEINADLLKEFTQQNAQYKKALEDNNKLKNLYFNISVDCRNINDQLKASEKEKKALISKEAEFQVLLEKERQQVSKLTTDLTAEREESERANMRISELQKEFSEKQKEFNDKLNKYIEEERTAARKEMEICAQCEKYAKNIKNLKDQLNNCQLQLAKQESNAELIDELKKKADYFKNYVEEKCKRFAQLHNVGTNTEATNEQTNVEVKVNGHREREDEDDLSAKTKLMLKEKEIRDQIAEKYTIEIKTIEMKCSKKLKEMENEHLCNINKLKQLLERKVDEVETLKQFILSERTKITEILDAKESEISILIKENNSLQSEFQEFRDKATDLKNTLEKAQAKISKLKIDFENKSTELTNEKEKFFRVQSELTQKLNARDSKVTQVETQYQLLKEKYKNIKKTVLTYKEYAAKKDVHVENELDRIKNHYKDIITDLQTKIQQLVNKRQQAEVSERINKIQSNFNAMMSDQNRQL